MQTLAQGTNKLGVREQGFKVTQAPGQPGQLRPVPQGAEMFQEGSAGNLRAAGSRALGGQSHQLWPTVSITRTRRRPYELGYRAGFGQTALCLACPVASSGRQLV